MNLDPNTSIAVMQASQGQVADTINNAKKSVNDKGLSDKDEKRFDEVAKDFEAMFVTEMMRPMFEQIKPDAQFGGGKGEEVFSGMMLQEYGKMMAETGQIGIADAVKQELIRLQEQADNPSKEIY